MKSKPTNSALLKQLPPDQLQNLLEQCERKKFAKNVQIVKEQEQNCNLYFIEKGTVGVAQFSAGGKEIGYIVLKEGENFGELSAIDGKPRSANVIAMSRCEITIMPFQVFKKLIESNSVASIALLKQLTEMVRRLCDRIYEFSTLSVSNRIHAELLRLARAGMIVDGQYRIESPPTHAQMASRLSCAREAVSRELNALEKAGVIMKERKCWTIPDCDVLEKMVNEVYKI